MAVFVSDDHHLLPVSVDLLHSHVAHDGPLVTLERLLRHVQDLVAVLHVARSRINISHFNRKNWGRAKRFSQRVHSPIQWVHFRYFRYWAMYHINKVPPTPPLIQNNS